MNGSGHLARYMQTDIFSMAPKPILWVGDSRAVVRAFPAGTRRDVGYRLFRVQRGLDPGDWRPMSSVGQGVRELRIHTGGEHRVLFLASRPEAVYVLHAFTKRRQRTMRLDIRVARARFRVVLNQSRER